MDTNVQGLDNVEQLNKKIDQVGNISQANDLENESIQVKSILLITPISRITYNIRVRSIEKVIKHVFGLTTTSEVIGIKTIDNVIIMEGLFFGSVKVAHSDKSEVLINKISKRDARLIKAFFEKVVEFQRRNVVNMTSD